LIHPFIIHFLFIFTESFSQIRLGALIQQHLTGVDDHDLLFDSHSFLIYYSGLK